MGDEKSLDVKTTFPNFASASVYVNVCRGYATSTRTDSVLSRSKGNDNWKISKAYVRALARFYSNSRGASCVCVFVYVGMSVWESAEWSWKKNEKTEKQNKVNSIQVRRRSEMFALLKCYSTQIRYWYNICVCCAMHVCHYFTSLYWTIAFLSALKFSSLIHFPSYKWSESHLISGAYEFRYRQLNIMFV